MIGHEGCSLVYYSEEMKKRGTGLDIRSHIYNNLVTALVCFLWLPPNLFLTWRVQSYSSSVEGRGSKDLCKNLQLCRKLIFQFIT